MIPYHLQLADAGYDIWLANNRGTWYSQGHLQYDATVDDEYWMFSWAEMGLYDDPANIKEVQSATGYEKIIYLGYSQGTIQMFYAMAHNMDYYTENLLKVVQLAPCFVVSTDPVFSPLELRATACHLFDLGVYSLSGPGWEENKEAICSGYPRLCPYVAWLDNAQPTSAKSLLYWATNSSVDRFQEYAEEFCSGHYEEPYVDLSQINGLPLGIFVGTNDTTCSYDHAQEYIP